MPKLFISFYFPTIEKINAINKSKQIKEKLKPD